MSFQQYRDIGAHITRIDTAMVREEAAACYLIQEGDQAAIIETGTRHTVPIILNLLEQRGIEKEQVRYVIPTHVHLDHAGGVGGLMQALPQAQQNLHPKGARHMIDPSKLKAGTLAVYGERVFNRLYGDVIPVPEERVSIAEDGDQYDLNGRAFIFYDTPGHARHHFCIHDLQSNGIFSGDTFGLSYPALNGDNKPFMMPTTTPVQFEPQALKSSIQRLLDLKPERIYLTHYGPVEHPEQLAPQLIEQIDDYVRIALQTADEFDDSEQWQAVISERLMQYTLKRLEQYQSPLTPPQQRSLIKMDMGLNSQGLVIWLQRQQG